ncbi:MAG: hypothetical protein K6C68_05075 [Ruminococcus sp.]|nr:hypothetical protein [Ruminococcus sp.]
MCDWSRQAIDVINGEKTLVLNELESGSEHTFAVSKAVGHGNSAYVYEAEYLSGGISHRCILKELFPRECGLKRDEKDRVTLYFAEQSSASKARYETIRHRYLNAYRIQNDFKNADHSELDSVEDKMLLSVGVSAPIGLYENEHGILYSVYECSSGLSYDKYKDSSLEDMLRIIIQTGNMISKYHKAGYIVLDIKESNILVTGGEDNRTAIQFDFDSLVKREDLINFTSSTSQDISISFTISDDMVPMPRELKVFHKSYIDRRIIDTERILNNLGKSGERTDIFLLAAVLYRRLFGCIPLKDLRNKENVWEIPEDASIYLTVQIVRDRLGDILSKALAADIGDRYETMGDLIDDLRELMYLSIVVDPEKQQLFAGSGLVTMVTQVTEEHLRTRSRKHWRALSDENGKFAQLRKFAQRFNSKVMLEDAKKNQFMPRDVIEQNQYVLLVGDGGMGKSTAVYDYWTEQKDISDKASKICLYIDLSHYSELHENTRNASEGEGLTVKDLPVDLLTYIMVNIIHSSGYSSLAIRQGDVLNDKALFKQMTALDHILSIETKSPKYVVILDGYNEILNRSDRAAFESNLGKALNKWKNASFVVTSRAVTIKNDEALEASNNNDVFARLSRFSFVGVPDDEIKASIKEHKDMSQEEISALTDDRIWEVLKIPMFLNMYLALHTEDTKTVHTRGELLDRFILNYEPMTANRIADPEDKNKLQHSSLRKFLIQYSLPFAANDMDNKRVFLSERNTFMSRMTLGNILYLTKSIGGQKISLYNIVFGNKDLSSSIGFNKKEYIDYTIKADMSSEEALELFISRDTIENIINNEAGYCYDTSDGKIAFTHQYYRDYFAAKQIQNILSAAKALGEAGLSRKEQLDFTKDNGLDYVWSDDVCILLGGILGDYKNDPEYTEK